MFEKALIDGDIVCYRCSAATENDDVAIACWQAGQMIERIMHETNAVTPVVFLTGSDNFRYSLYPDYKANRRDHVRPKHWAAIREYLATRWNATVTDGYEADDALGMEQMAEQNTVICTIDKDLLMIPGWNYNFVKQEMVMVSPLDGLRHFYYQLILGDRVDNIVGFDGKIRDKVPKFVQPHVDQIYDYTEELDMYQYLCAIHFDIDVMNTMGKCLWIWRKENDVWIPPNERKQVEPSKAQELHYCGAEVHQPEVPPEV